MLVMVCIHCIQLFNFQLFSYISNTIYDNNNDNKYNVNGATSSVCFTITSRKRDLINQLIKLTIEFTETISKNEVFRYMLLNAI